MFDKFRKIFWMVIATIFVVWLFLFLKVYSTEINVKLTGQVPIITKINKLSGTVKAYSYLEKTGGIGWIDITKPSPEKKY